LVFLVLVGGQERDREEGEQLIEDGRGWSWVGVCFVCGSYLDMMGAMVFCVWEIWREKCGNFIIFFAFLYFSFFPVSPHCLVPMTFWSLIFFPCILIPLSKYFFSYFFIFCFFEKCNVNVSINSMRKNQ